METEFELTLFLVWIHQTQQGCGRPAPKAFRSFVDSAEVQCPAGDCNRDTAVNLIRAQNLKEAAKTTVVGAQVNPASKLVFTVSPIPLGVTFDYESVFVADCVSKSTLRAAVDEVIREAPSNVMYWPTFEVFRWLGAYTGPVYGADDGSSAHASEFVVNLIFKEFFERFCFDGEVGVT